MTRTDLLNHLAEKYNLQRYLEIGVQDPAQNFDKIICPYKSGVDPDPKSGAFFEMTSDEFFDYWKDVEADPFDIIFIDGLHTAEQVKKDFENALKILSPNGFIVLHDCNPQKEEHTIVPRPKSTGHWNGDVYRFALYMTYWAWDYRPYVVDIDNGCLVFHRGEHDFYQPSGLITPAWEHFNANRKELLNLISWEDFIAMQ
jgi:hypothetical protein